MRLKKQTARAEEQRSSQSAARAVQATKRLSTALNKQFPGTFVSLSEASSSIKLWYRSGLDVLDYVLTGTDDHGGFPSGRLVEIYGRAHLGKSTMGALIMAHAQRDHDAVVCLIDTESTFTPDRAKALGVNPDTFLYNEEIYVEHIVDQILEFVQRMKDTPSVIFWDTVAQSRTLHDKGRKTGEQKIAAHAQILSQGMRRMAKVLANSNSLVIVCNQQKVGALGDPFATERDKEATLGGEAIRLAAEARIGMGFARKLQMELRVNGNKRWVTLGSEVEAKIVKNKNAPSDVKVRLVLNNRKGGIFDNARSTLHTMQQWGAYPKKAERLVVAGQKVTRNQWLVRYEEDDAFRQQVMEAFAETYQQLYKGGE